MSAGAAMSLVKSRVARLDSISKTIWAYLKADLRQEEETIELMKDSLAALQSTISFMRKERTRSISKQARKPMLALATNEPATFFTQASFKPPKYPHQSSTQETEQNRRLEVSLNIAQPKVTAGTPNPPKQSPKTEGLYSSSNQTGEADHQTASDIAKKQQVFDFGYESMEQEVASPQDPKDINIFADRRESFNGSFHITRVREQIKNSKSRTPVTSKRRLSSKNKTRLSRKSSSKSRRNSGSASKPSSHRKYVSLAELLPLRSPLQKMQSTVAMGDTRADTVEVKVPAGEFSKASFVANSGILKHRPGTLTMHRDASLQSRMERPRGSTQEDRFSQERLLKPGVRTFLSTELKLEAAQQRNAANSRDPNLFVKHSIVGFAREPVVDDLSNSGKTPPSTAASDVKPKTSRITRDRHLLQSSDFSKPQQQTQRAKLSGETQVFNMERLPESQVLTRERPGLEKGVYYASSPFAKKKSTNN